jgi:RNA polymerase primary sigma factor
MADLDGVDQYLKDVGQYALLTVDEENALGRDARLGDEAAIAEMVSRNLRFVISVAKKYQNRGLPLSDLIGEGNVGLLTAARKYDPTQGVRFITYAVWWIRQAILSAIARQSHIVRLPPNRIADLTRIKRAADVLRQRLQREPNPGELAEETGMPLALVRSLHAVGLRDVSLDSPMTGESEQTLLDRFGSEEAEETDSDVAGAQLKERLELALGSLPPRDARILRLQFGMEGGREHTLEEIGVMLGVTRERVRQLRDRALRRLREGASRKALREYADRPEEDPLWSGIP